VNIGLFVGVAVLVSTGKAQSSQPVLSASPSILASAAQESTGPLDELSSADIAVNVAKLTALPEANSVQNKADTINAGLAVAAADEKVVAKPQIVSEGLKSKQDIIEYVTKKGDTVENIAEKFGITPKTVKNSNNLEGNTVAVGVKLLISPVDGLVYQVSSGDTPASIAGEFEIDKESLISINDAELTNKFKVGEYIIIPDGVVKQEEQSTPASYGSVNSFSFGFTPIYGGNNYAYGWCTYYAAARSGAPGGWGNASSWAYYAGLSGWTVSAVPIKGAIAQRSGGAGHVGIVEDVRIHKGRLEIRYSDMNGLAGFNAVGTSGWEPAHQSYENFIYR
jgi:surface antigen